MSGESKEPLCCALQRRYPEFTTDMDGSHKDGVDGVAGVPPTLMVHTRMAAAHPLTLEELCRRFRDGEHAEVRLDDQLQQGVGQQGLSATGNAQQRRSQVPAGVVDREDGVARSGGGRQEGLLRHKGSDQAYC